MLHRKHKEVHTFWGLHLIVWNQSQCLTLVCEIPKQQIITIKMQTCKTVALFMVEKQTINYRVLSVRLINYWLILSPLLTFMWIRALYYLLYAYMYPPHAHINTHSRHSSQLQIHSGMHKSGQQIKVVITFKPRKVKDCMAGSNGSLLNRE